MDLSTEKVCLHSMYSVKRSYTCDSLMLPEVSLIKDLGVMCNYENSYASHVAHMA